MIILHPRTELSVIKGNGDSSISMVIVSNLSLFNMYLVSIQYSTQYIPPFASLKNMLRI